MPTEGRGNKAGSSRSGKPESELYVIIRRYAAEIHRMVLADRSHKVMCRAIGCHHLTLKRVLKFMDRQAEMIANAITTKEWAEVEDQVWKGYPGYRAGTNFKKTMKELTKPVVPIDPSFFMALEAKTEEEPAQAPAESSAIEPGEGERPEFEKGGAPDIDLGSNPARAAAMEMTRRRNG